MDCVINLQLSNYDIESNQVKAFNKPLGLIDQNQDITLDEIVNRIASLSKEERSELAAQLRAARSQTLTRDMLMGTDKGGKLRTLTSNITLSDLITQYPDLSQYNIPLDLQTSFTLIKCKEAVLNGDKYKGRLETSDGREIFIINDYWDAKKVFNHLSAKYNLRKFIQGDELDPSLEKYAEDLKIIATRHHKTIQQVVENYLVNKNAYRTFKQGSKLYTPKRVLGNVLRDILGQTQDIEDKSELHLELETIKEPGSDNQIWKFEKKRLYDVLSTFSSEFAETYSYDQFKNLSEDALNQVLKPIFASDVKLIKTSVASITQGEIIKKEDSGKTKDKHVMAMQIQSLYESRIKPYLEANADAFPELLVKDKVKVPNKYQDAAKKLGYKLATVIRTLSKSEPFTITTAEGNSVEIEFEMDKYKLTAFYEVKEAPKVRETNSYIKLRTGVYSTLGEIYDPSYEFQTWFEYVEKYKGFYIYVYNSDGVPHYAISRSIINHKTQNKTYSTLEFAKAAIDDNKDTLKSAGLWSIKQQTGRPRETAIEMVPQIKEGQIISTLDLKLPSTNIDKLSAAAKTLMEGTVKDFQNTLAFIDNIQTLDTPEKATAFILLTHDKLAKGDDFLMWLHDNHEVVQNTIQTINDAETIHYKVEYTSYKKGAHSKYLVKLLPNEGLHFNEGGNIADLTTQDFIMSSLTDTINHINEVFGINIYPMSKTELEMFSKENDLGLELKLDTTKAFVYNGQIYINASIADASDLFHELSHMLLGVLKIHNPEVYQEILGTFAPTSKFKFKYNENEQKYKHYAQQDIIEEALADVIAEELFKHKKLGTSELSGSEVIDLFENIFKRSQAFVQMMPDNGIGFAGYMRTLLDDNSDKLKRKMLISDLVQRYIDEGRIIENC